MTGQGGDELLQGSVQAEVTVSSVDGQRQVREPVPVLPDLGRIEFDEC